MEKYKNKTIPTIISIVLAFTMLFGLGSVSAEFDDSAISETYDYNIKEETWRNFKTHTEMTEACQIKDYDLCNMTTDKLINSVLKYPLLMDIYAYDNIQQGYESVYAKFNGLKELEKREDASKKC